MATPKEVAEKTRGNLIKYQAWLEEPDVEKPDETVKDAVPNGKLIVKQLVIAGKAISSEATKISLAYSGDVNLDDCTKLCQNLEQAVVAFIACFKTLPLDAGRAFRSAVLSAAKTVIEGLLVFTGQLASGDSRAQLHDTGKVWDFCDALQNVPQDNKTAVLNELTNIGTLIEDATEELQEASTSEGGGWDEEDGFGGDVKWSEEERKPVARCLQLLKAGSKLVGRMKKDVQGAHSPAYMDDLLLAASGLSACVDNLVSSLYPPQSAHAIVTYATALAKASHDCITVVRAGLGSEEDKFLDVVALSADHALTNLRQQLPIR
eukprot:Colp12_sorted_trinity150504_noHs@29518